MTKRLLFLVSLIMAIICCFKISNAQSNNNTIDIQPSRGQRLPSDPADIPLLKAAVSPSSVLSLFAKIDMNRARSRVNKLASYPDRYYQSASGLKASEWLLSQLNSLAGKCQIKVARVNHSWRQFSLIATLNGGGAVTTPVLVIGSHFDTNRNTGRGMPGADDNASGTVTALEALQVLCESNTKTPKGPIEFHFYSGEELGFLGSTQIVRQYQAAGRRLRGYVNFDMTSVSSGGDGSKEMGFFRDYTNRTLTRSVKQLAVTYTQLRPYDITCGTPCSDNYPWNKAGYAAVWPFEGGDNRFYNTPRDTVQLMDFNHMKEFIKLAIAAATQL